MMGVLSGAFDTPQEREDFIRNVLVGVVAGIVTIIILKKVL